MISQQVLVKCEGASFIGPKLRTAPDQISLATRSVIQEGFLIPATCYIEALSLRATLSLTGLSPRHSNAATPS